MGYTYQGSMMGNQDTPTSHADAAYEAIRAINHITMGRSIPAPEVYTILGNLKNVGHLLPQALTQIADGLTHSLTTHTVYEAEGADPATSVNTARTHLLAAGELAATLAQHLEQAQSAIASQGYNNP